MADIRFCKRCVMNNASDRTIIFDENGFCNYCSKALSEIDTRTYFPNETGKRKLDDLIKKIKSENADKKYDCMMGISGGLDSAYLAFLGYKWGLRILAVHIDDGFDTEISKSNIQKLCEAANIKLRTIKPDPVQYNDLTLSYIKAGVPDIAVPQDNILFAFLYDVAKREKIRYFLSGGNFALESILQRDYNIDAYDTVNIKAIHKRFGNEKIDKLKLISREKKFIYDKLGIVQSERPLNFIDYNRDRAFKELYDFCGFEYYGSKHLENMLTAFLQLCWMPQKFGVDKRSSHLSSMIVSGQMTREEAFDELRKPIYNQDLMDEYIDVICDKLKITRDELEYWMIEPNHEHTDYKYDKFFAMCRNVKKYLK